LHDAHAADGVAEKAGVKTIAITNIAYSSSVTSRHPSGKRLFEACNIVLDNKVVYKEHETTYLNSGMLSFGVGHILYFVAATLIAISLNDVYSYNYSTVTMLISLGVSIVLSTTIMLLSKPLKLNFGKFFFQTLAYTLILTFMSAYSIILAIAVPSLWPFATGICMIFVSDLVLSTQYFGGQQDNKLLIILNHLIYYVGQIFIAISLFM